MIIMALALAVQATGSFPRPHGPPYPEHHMGWHSCEDWTRARAVSRERAMEEWVWGYLTALDRYAPLREADASAGLRRTIWGRLDAYCAAHPRATFGEAVSLLVENSRRRGSGGR